MLAAIELRAVVAVPCVVVAVVGIMTYSGEGPHVVQCPDYGLTCSDDSLYRIERKHTVIYPMQVDYIGLLELWQIGDIPSRAPKVDGVNTVATEVGVYRNGEPLS